ncbi:putative RNase H-like nuclease (RuvC/YqgF family) [Evansella vedderi]|uniref:RNase H-like nuclease (RuvC/YqgF family) n=1 Tax=Evansella vedderi TaxID=38282 RepID=A0ABT9ZXS7_9BACI|nr:hypothetical protein [Evansella vedderi]MDQ0254935.1 putative RNase H-like nuclease (RuvC/YqgF family) [Evansella vedderi]
MQVKIENAKLGQAADLLFNLSLKGKQSRHRTKFIKVLNERLKEVEEQRVQLAKEHSRIDDKGEPQVVDGKFDIMVMEDFQKDLKELYKEELVIEGGDAQGMLKTVKDILLKSLEDKEWEGQEAVIYDYLCDQFEGGEE